MEILPRMPGNCGDVNCLTREDLSDKNMDSWLVDVKRVRIPRPKFAGKYPAEPPKDYYCEEFMRDDKRTAATFLTSRNMAKATEDLRRELQDKL